MSFLKRIELEMQNQNLSQSELAKKLDCSRSAVNFNLKMWRGGKVPKLITLKKWCLALGVDYKKFISEL